MLALVFVMLSLTSALKMNGYMTAKINHATTRINALRRVAPGSSAPVFKPGVDIPQEIAQQNSIYDMILVERCNAPEKTDVGLFIPQVEGQDNGQVAQIFNRQRQTHGPANVRTAELERLLRDSQLWYLGIAGNGHGEALAASYSELDVAVELALRLGLERDVNLNLVIDCNDSRSGIERDAIS